MAIGSFALSGSRQVTPPAPAAARQAASSGFFEFFQYHGIWAIGVRLFRNLRFRSKAACISLAFGLPLAVLAWSYFSTVSAAIRSTALERHGVAIIQAMSPLLDAVQAQRTSVEGSKAPKQNAGDLEPLLLKAKQALQAHGGAIGLDDEVRNLEAAHQTFRSAVVTPANVAETYDTYAEALMHLVDDVVDHSSLSLDPDVDTYFLMRLSTSIVPEVIEYTSRTRGLAAWAAQRDKVPADVTHKLAAYAYFAKVHAD